MDTPDLQDAVNDNGTGKVGSHFPVLTCKFFPPLNSS